MIVNEGGCWLVAGDFNAVRSLQEKKGKTGEKVDMGEFNDFIETAGLVDVRLVNRCFTWYRPDGTSMSRLDRFLMSTEMCSMSGEWIQQGLKRTISDHCPIILKSRIVDWGPKPFRVLDVWQQHPDFKKVIEEKWESLKVEGFASFKCQQKLKMLKEFLKGWNKDVFGDVEAQFREAVKKVENVDLKNEELVLEGFEVAQRQEGFQELWEILRKKEAIWRQKARSNWIKLGDANTGFFHKVASGRRAHNGITGLMCDGRWVEEPELVRKQVVKYFKEMFQGDLWTRPKPNGVSFRQISKDQQAWLERPFSAEEIEEGLNSCEGNKAPGLDEFNFNFIKLIWSSMKEDFVSFFEEFHQRGRLVRGLNSSFITLIPKKLNPIELKDFRPITLIGCVYKLLAKVLANRLKNVMFEIITESQSAFVGGRQLVDSVLILNEVVDEAKKKKQQAFIFKADFEKVYDCVD
ncbi:hypothetical protein SLA2020_387070 [Shorea laevis]